jgi:hypothetical protein
MTFDAENPFILNRVIDTRCHADSAASNLATFSHMLGPAHEIFKPAWNRDSTRIGHIAFLHPPSSTKDSDTLRLSVHGTFVPEIKEKVELTMPQPFSNRVNPARQIFKRQETFSIHPRLCKSEIAWYT